jgi:HAAS
MTIDAYLAELERRLPRLGRRRAAAEVREHLRDAAARQRAAGRSPLEAEAAATHEFGPVEDVAARLASELAVRDTRLAAVLALAASALFVFPLYVVPENTLPPATWVEKPRDIALLQQLAVGSWLLGCTLALVGMAFAWTRWPLLPVYALCGTALAVAASTAVSAVLVARWFALTSATPSWALAAPLALGALAVCVGAALWARSSARRRAQPA